MSANITVDIKIGKKVVESKIDAKLEEAIRNFVEIKKEIDLNNELLKAIKEDIVKEAKEVLKSVDETGVTFVAGNNSLKVAFGWDINISDEATLTELLGDRFDDLVTTKVSYSPTQKLKEMSLQDDGLKKCLTVKEKAPTVTIAK
ncbi:hypothetical protein N5U20_09825 [Aliarcobacter butzleri]|uniref:hypothetical protein n=1 Tax=Aliarcobacter butzleri TaxID=28197 RepID=UPI0021B55F01|nr:hypothetical protein [Aliarcobacter butzleri]MCT7613504.1 hypothetical protein [Aliarcobacter butzleri]